MKRRELLKSGLTVAGAAMLSGCGSNNETGIKKNGELTIAPKQTDVYKLSVAMLFDFDALDRFAKWNQEHKKIKIETVYNSIPLPLSERYNEWVQLWRGGSNPKIKSFDDYAKYVKRSFDNGFKVCYLMNSPKPFNLKDLDAFKDDFYRLLDNLWDIGVDNIKVANTQAAALITEHNPEFKLTASTIFEYNAIAQYTHLLELYPNFVNLGVAKNQNQNFRFLRNLKKKFPDKTIEVMVGEGCIKNCPTRVSCMSCSSTGKFKHGCKLTRNDRENTLMKFGDIHPWYYPYYSAIGTNNFKVVPLHQRASDTDAPHVKSIMDVAEYGIESEAGIKYLEKMLPFVKGRKFNPKDIITFLPDIEYFIKHGHDCDSICGVECDYCDRKAEKLRNIISELHV